MMTKEEIIRHVFLAAEIVTGLKTAEFVNAIRIPEYVLPRHLIQWYLLTNDVCTTTEASTLTGKTNHSTSIHGKKTINTYLETKQKEYYGRVIRFKELMNGFMLLEKNSDDFIGEIDEEPLQITLWFRNYRIAYNNKQLTVIKGDQPIAFREYENLTLSQLTNITKSIINEHIRSV